MEIQAPTKRYKRPGHAFPGKVVEAMLTHSVSASTAPHSS